MSFHISFVAFMLAWQTLSVSHASSMKVATVSVLADIPDTLCGQPGRIVDVSINLIQPGDLDSISGFWFTLFFDPAVVDFHDVIHRGTMGERLGRPEVQITGVGKITVGSPLGTTIVPIDTSPPALTILQFRIRSTAQGGDSTALRFGVFELSLRGDVTRGSGQDGWIHVQEIADKLVVVRKIAAPGVAAQKLMIRLENNRAVCGLQFTARFDPLLLRFNSVGLATRTRGWRVNSRIFGDSANVLLFHIPNDSLTAGTDPILEIDFDVLNAAKPGDSTRVELKNALGSNCAGDSIMLATKDDYVVFGLKGDLDADGDRDQTDLDILVDIIINPALQDPYTRWAGDLNDDEHLNIVDVILLNNIVNPGGSASLLASVLNRMSGAASLYWGEVRTEGSRLILPLVLSVSGEVKGIQFTLPSGHTSPMNVIEQESRFSQMRIVSGQVEDRVIVLFFRSGRELIPKTSFEILHLELGDDWSAMPVISDFLAVDATGQGLTTRTQVEEEMKSPASLKDFFLVYPNPFRNTTTFRVGLKTSARVAIEIFDILGRSVASLDCGQLEAGLHTLSWNAKDGRGVPLVAGSYYYVASLEPSRLRGRLVILK